MKYAVIAATLFISGTVQAQTLIDEPKGVDATLAKQIAADVADQFTDPLTTQLRRIQPLSTHQGVICGEVNTKNLYGGYVGFKPFRYIVDQRKVYLVNTGCE